jgi:hypothetical protein
VEQGARRAGEHGHLRDLPVHEALDRAVVGPDAPDRRLARRLVQLEQATPQPRERLDPRPGPAADRDLAHPVADAQPSDVLLRVDRSSVAAVLAAQRRVVRIGDRPAQRAGSGCV